MKSKNDKLVDPKLATRIVEKIFRIRSHPNVSEKNRIVRAYIFGFDELVPAVNKVMHMPELDSEDIVTQTNEHRNEQGGKI